MLEEKSRRRQIRKSPQLIKQIPKKMIDAAARSTFVHSELQDT
jgi:hypothetical protein